jgi:hypothetical protein
MSLITINRFVVAGPGGAAPARSPFRRRAATGAALLAALGLGLGVNAALATPPNGSTTNVSFVPLATPYKLFTAKSFAAHALYSPVVIGGSTKIPTNATTVRLQVEAGGKTAGTMTFYPAGNVNGGSGQSLTWSAGGTATATIEENVGTANELTIANGSAASTGTATITGYSAQVTAADIAPADGAAGEVLTNTGTGAAWLQPPATFTNVKVVAQTDTAVAAGTQLVNAINAVNGSTPTTILLEPGTYDVGNSTIALPANLAIYGTSATTTTIESAATGRAITAAAADVITGVTINDRPAGSDYSVAVAVPGGASLTLKDAALSMSGTPTNAHGLSTVQVLGDGSLDAERSSLTSAVTGPSDTPDFTVSVQDAGTATITDSQVGASAAGVGDAIGVVADGGDVTVRDSNIVVTAAPGTSLVSEATGASLGFGNLALIGSTVTVGSVGTGYTQVEGVGGAGFGVSANLTIESSVINTSDNTFGGATAISADSVSVTLDASKVSSGKFGTALDANGGTIQAGASMIDGYIAGTPTCADSYNQNYVALPSSC